jgi:hypothetical protein
MKCSDNQSRDVVRVVFRYDDCSARSSIELERRLVEVFANCGAQLTLGVIPFVAAGDWNQPIPQPKRALPPEKIAMLREAAANGHVEIALHGYFHQVWGSRESGEFGGLSPDQQRQRLQRGKTELENRLETSVTTFIPPWNAYDEKTIEFMGAVGFNCLSASLRGPFCGNSKIGFLPASCWFHGLEKTVRSALRFRRLRPVIVVMMHDFDFMESGSKDAWLWMSEFGSQVEKLAHESNVRVCSLRQAWAEGAALTPERLIPYQLWRQTFRRSPWQYRHLFENQVLWTTGIGTYSSIPLWCYQAYVSCRSAVPYFAAAVARRLRRAKSWNKRSA